jgi:hypothetical protein
MRSSFSAVILCAAAAGLALPVLGQDATTPAAPKPAGKPAQVARQPYTAEYKVTHVKTLASGGAITQESSETVALDSQGRKMTSATPAPLQGEKAPVTRISVSDPVARTNSNWTVPGKKATVVAMPAPGAPHKCAPATPPATPPAPAPPRVKPTVEDLGTQTINGVEARGRRVTSTTPAGAVGNDQPLVRTDESWTATAPGLKGFVARDISDGPQSGKTTKELSNLTQAEPDASLFQPPAGYEIVNKLAPGSDCPAEEGTEPTTAPIPVPPPPPPQ